MGQASIRECTSSARQPHGAFIEPKPKHMVAGESSQTSPENPGTSPSRRRRDLVQGAWQRGAVTSNGDHDARTRIYDLG